MKIDIYSHAIRVTDVTTERDLEAMYSFCKPLIEFGLEKKRGRFVPRGLRTFAAATKDRREFGFHRNQLDDLKKHLFKRLGYVEHLVPITVHDIDMNKVAKVDFKIANMHEPREVQVGIIDYILDTEDPKYDPIIKMVTLQTGQGKALRDDVLVKVPNGWTKVSDLKVGDTVYGRSGDLIKVTGVFPQGRQPIMEMITSDNRVIPCSKDHLWTVWSLFDQGEVTLTIEEIHRRKGNREYFMLPLYDAPVPAYKLHKYINEHLPGAEVITIGGRIENIEANIKFDPVRVAEMAKVFWSYGGEVYVLGIPSSNTILLKVMFSRRTTFTIRDTGKSASCTCIKVDAPDGLFVAENHVVTHNTFISQYSMNKLGWRTAIHFKGGYVARWRDDLEDTFSFDKGEFLIVKGAKDMIALQKMALEGVLKAMVIIITTGTMREYIKDYEESNGKSKKYPIKPMDFYPALGIGLRVSDEFHLEFHNSFRIDLYTHVPRSLALSATMVSSDAFKNRMYDIACPVNQRNDGGAYKVYIGVTEVKYHMDPDIELRHMGGQGYSHTTYEESIMRHKGILKSYLKIVEAAIYNRFIQYREDGQKALVFFATVDLCTVFVERLKKLYPELDIVRYAASTGDSYDDILEADITVSTLGSAGTAIDIPNLRCSFMTTAIDSRQSNEQALGRTRPLKDWSDVTPEFVYFSCIEIEQHGKYSNNKRAFFKGRVVYHGQVISRYTLGKPT